MTPYLSSQRPVSLQLIIVFLPYNIAATSPQAPRSIKSMASVASASPSGQGFLYANSTEDTDSWQYVETNSSPAGYVHSPSSSFNGWGVIGYPNHLGTSPTAMSPLPPPTSHPNRPGTVNSTADDSHHFLSLWDNQQILADHNLFLPDSFGSTYSSADGEYW